MPAYRIECDPARGRHMIATRDLAAGELILEDEPLVVGPATKSRFEFIDLSQQTFIKQVNTIC